MSDGAQVHVATQIVVEGTVPSKVVGDMEHGEVRAVFAGTLQLVIKDRQALDSVIACLREIERFGTHLWPNPDAFGVCEQEERDNWAKFGEKGNPVRRAALAKGRATRNQRRTDNGRGLELSR